MIEITVIGESKIVENIPGPTTLLSHSHYFAFTSYLIPEKGRLPPSGLELTTLRLPIHHPNLTATRTSESEKWIYKLLYLWVNIGENYIQKMAPQSHFNWVFSFKLPGDISSWSNDEVFWVYIQLSKGFWLKNVKQPWPRIELTTSWLPSLHSIHVATRPAL